MAVLYGMVRVPWMFVTVMAIHTLRKPPRGLPNSNVTQGSWRASLQLSTITRGSRTRHMSVTVLSSRGADSDIRREKDRSDEEFLNPRSAKAGHTVMLRFMLTLRSAAPCLRR